MDKPSGLDVMLEAVEKYMGEQFTEMLEQHIEMLIDDAAWSATIQAVKLTRL
jgi:hypothetical protein